MNQIDLLRVVEKDQRVLDIAAAAMYKIREPKGSTRRSFDQLSHAKQARNRELAILVLRAVFERYPDPSTVASPAEVKVFLAEQMYMLLAPRKSETFPFDKRTPYAQSYYQERAETFMRNFLLPLVEQNRPAAVNDRKSLGKSDTSMSTPQQPRKTGELPRHSSAQTLPPSRPTTVDLPIRSTVPSRRSPSVREDARPRTSIPGAEPIALGPPAAGSSSQKGDNESSTADATTASETSQPSAMSMIGCLLFIIAILLLILVIRTFF